MHADAQNLGGARGGGADQDDNTAVVPDPRRRLDREGLARELRILVRLLGHHLDGCADEPADGVECEIIGAAAVRPQVHDETIHGGEVGEGLVERRLVQLEVLRLVGEVAR